LNPEKLGHFGREEHQVIIALVSHLNKSLAQFNKTPSIRGFSQG